MTSSTLQVSLLYRPSSLSPIRNSQLSLSPLPRYTLPLSTYSLSVSFKSRLCRHRLLLHSTLHPDNNNNNILSNSSPQESTVSTDINSDLIQESQVTNLLNESNNEVENLESKTEGLEMERDDFKSKVPILVFLMGVFGTMRTKFHKLIMSDWFNWWPFWRQEKRLELLIADADANPKDATKQSALFAELNKHRYEVLF